MEPSPAANFTDVIGPDDVSRNPGPRITKSLSTVDAVIFEGTLGYLLMGTEARNE